MSRREPKERIARRVREFRKRQRADLKQSNSFIFELKKYIRDRGLTADFWVSAADVYDHTIVLREFLSFDKFVESIRGNKHKGSKFDETIKPVRHIEISTAWIADAEIILIRQVRIPATRRKS